MTSHAPVRNDVERERVAVEARGAQPAVEATIFELSTAGEDRRRFPAYGGSGTATGIPVELARRERAGLPRVAEPTLVRHFVRLSQRNHSIDSGFYPLGSCTMKYNPKVNDEVAALPGFSRCHPLQEPSQCQGLLEVLWELQSALSALAGLPAVSLAPAAGAHGELLGLLLMRRWHEDRVARGEIERIPDVVLIPDTAHGTNPASAAMAGFRTVTVPSTAQGGMDPEAVSAACAEHDIAGLMVTNPSTVGTFDGAVAEIARTVHDAGGLLYYDGANLNAIMGRVRPGDMGFDIVHVNVHKTLSTPHGGGGPGAGPVAVAEHLRDYLPVPRVVRSGDGTFDVAWSDERSIGRISHFHGNVGVLVRAWAYVRRNGADGLARASDLAVLNANYLRVVMANELTPEAFPGTCMHEFVLTARELRERTGVRALDVAKRIMDHGFHPPTMYFPLIVDEALMFEPTETETRATLDRFAAAYHEVLREAEASPEIVTNAPHTTIVRRVDEVRAARHPVLVDPVR